MSSLKEPFLADDAFLDDVASSRGRPGLHIWWLGQSGFLVSDGELFAVLDPYLSDSLTAKYANTDKPHVRMTRRVVDPRSLDFVSIAASSHNHTDHLDGETLRPLMEVNPDLRVIISEANRLFVAQRLVTKPDELIGLRDGQTISHRGWAFTGVPAAHEDIERDVAGCCKYLGFVIKVGPFTIYHSGDTLLYHGMVERLRPMEIDIALLPINGRAPQRRVAGNMNGREAASLARQIDARMVIPCHYDMFEFNTASPHEFVAECHRLEQPYRVLRQGERFSMSERDGSSTQVGA